MIKVLVIDDHPLFRMGLSALIAAERELEAVGEGASALEAIELAERFQPDVILLDVRLRASSGIEACREIRSRRPHSRVLMLTSYEDEEALIASVLAGASGYLLKDAEPQQLVDAIHTVARGESTLDPATTRTLLAWLRREHTASGPDPLASLSAQERNILPLIAEGKTNREIAAALSLSENTVKTYISDVLQKLQATRRSELAAFVARLMRAERLY